MREKVRDHLIRQILDGRLAPGARIVEARIAHQCGVSQAPVREALRDLELFGLVVSSPFRGAVVRRMSIEDHLQLYSIRAVHEGLAARYAAPQITRAALRRLEDAMVVMRRASACQDTRVQTRADVRFHRIIMLASANWRLLQSWEWMQLETAAFLMVAPSLRSLHDTAERHEPVFEALKAHDPARAEHEMRRHVEELGQWLRDALVRAPITLDYQ